MMQQTKVAVLDDYDESISKLSHWEALLPDFSVTFFSTPQAPETLADYEVIVTVRERTIVDAKFLSHLSNLKHLAVTGRLSGQADLAELKRRGISASFTEGSGQSAAELTIALVLTLAKGTHDHHQVVRNGGWQTGPGTSLKGKTLGILGLGRVGTKIAQFGRLMEMNVVSWGPTEDQGRSQKLGISRTNLDEVLRASDFLSICLRLSPTTRGLLDAGKLRLLKDGACLVNTARAEITDQAALYSELKSGRVFGAFDVFHTEPLPIGDPIRTFPNVLLSPHMGYVTHEVYETFFSQVVENLLAWKKGQPYRNALEA